MSNSAQEITDAALKLPELERIHLVEELLSSLSPQTEKVLEEEWAAELARRLADYRQSPQDAVPWQQLKDQQ